MADGEVNAMAVGLKVRFRPFNRLLPRIRLVASDADISRLALRSAVEEVCHRVVRCVSHDRRFSIAFEMMAVMKPSGSSSKIMPGRDSFSGPFF